MIAALIISQIVSWVLLIATIVALLAVARQVGVLHERLAPIGALTPGHGPAVGTKAPHIVARTMQGELLEIGGELPPGRRRMILFVSTQCPICKKLIPFAKSFARAENVELIFAGDDTVEAQTALIKGHDLSSYRFLNDESLGRALAVDKVPHTVLLDDRGTIIARGLVNSREHLESMMVAHETGLSSVQKFLHERLEKTHQEG